MSIMFILLWNIAMAEICVNKYTIKVLTMFFIYICIFILNIIEIFDENEV